MKKILFILLLAGCAATMTAQKPVNIVFIGNSITHGATLLVPKTQAPPVKTAEKLQQQTGRTVRFRNCGVSGMTTLDFLPAAHKQWPKVVQAADELAQMDGQLIFSIMLGTNDSAEKGPFGAPVHACQYYTNMKVIIDELLVRYPKSKVIIQYPLWYSPNTYNGAIYLKAGLERLKSYLPMIDTLAAHYAKEKKPRVFAGNKETFSFFENRLDLFTDEKGNAGTFHLHPNLQGGDHLADFWTKSIILLLE